MKVLYGSIQSGKPLTKNLTRFLLVIVESGVSLRSQREGASASLVQALRLGLSGLRFKSGRSHHPEYVVRTKMDGSFFVQFERMSG
jgi:hypothetical protein